MCDDLAGLVDRLKDLVCQLEDRKQNHKEKKGSPCQCLIPSCKPQNQQGAKCQCTPLAYPPCNCPYYYMWMQCMYPHLFQNAQTDEEDDDSEDESDTDCDDGGNFYNNYNHDWHAKSKNEVARIHANYLLNKLQENNKDGVTVDGQNPRDTKRCSKPEQNIPNNGCFCLPPPGLGKCKMQMFAPAGGDPSGLWKAELQPCNHKKCNGLKG